MKYNEEIQSTFNLKVPPKSTLLIFYKSQKQIFTFFYKQLYVLIFYFSLQFTKCNVLRSQKLAIHTN